MAGQPCYLDKHFLLVPDTRFAVMSPIWAGKDVDPERSAKLARPSQRPQEVTTEN